MPAKKVRFSDNAEDESAREEVQIANDVQTKVTLKRVRFADNVDEPPFENPFIVRHCERSSDINASDQSSDESDNDSTNDEQYLVSCRRGFSSRLKHPSQEDSHVNFQAAEAVLPEEGSRWAYTGSRGLGIRLVSDSSEEPRVMCSHPGTYEDMEEEYRPLLPGSPTSSQNLMQYSNAPASDGESDNVSHIIAHLPPPTLRRHYTDKEQLNRLDWDAAKEPRFSSWLWDRFPTQPRQISESDHGCPFHHSDDGLDPLEMGRHEAQPSEQGQEEDYEEDQSGAEADDEDDEAWETDEDSVCEAERRKRRRLQRVSRISSSLRNLFQSNTAMRSNEHSIPSRSESGRSSVTLGSEDSESEAERNDRMTSLPLLLEARRGDAIISIPEPAGAVNHSLTKRRIGVFLVAMFIIWVCIEALVRCHFRTDECRHWLSLYE